MFFVGIDIGKRHHEAAIIDEVGHPVGKSIRFSNSKAGSEKLLEFINKHELLPDNTLIGLEATGHYWLSVFSFLLDLEFNVVPFNPIQSDSLRNFYIRKTKTDTIDAVLIAQVIRMDLPDQTYVPSENIVRLKQLTRFRYSIVDQISDIKRKVIASLDQVFPEYETLFSDMFGKSSTQLLLQSPLPEDLLEIDSQKLVELLNQASNGRLSLEKSTGKVLKLKELAEDSFGIKVASDVYKLQIQLLLQQILLLENQLEMVEAEIAALIAMNDNHLTTIIGVGPITAAVIIAEVGDIHRFERPNQLLAFAGLDASVHQSGDFLGRAINFLNAAPLISDVLFGKLPLSLLIRTLLYPSTTKVCVKEENITEQRLALCVVNWSILFLPFGPTISHMNPTSIATYSINNFFTLYYKLICDALN